MRFGDALFFGIQIWGLAKGLFFREPVLYSIVGKGSVGCHGRKMYQPLDLRMGKAVVEYCIRAVNIPLPGQRVIAVDFTNLPSSMYDDVG